VNISERTDTDNYWRLLTVHLRVSSSEGGIEPPFSSDHSFSFRGRKWIVKGPKVRQRIGVIVVLNSQHGADGIIGFHRHFSPPLCLEPTQFTHRYFGWVL